MMVVVKCSWGNFDVWEAYFRRAGYLHIYTSLCIMEIRGWSVWEIN